MEWTGLNELREKYLSFFESKGHLRLPSFSLVPQGDKSLLLINAGMAPLKKYFTGELTPPRTRVTTCQKCIRTPDIERVGITARHGTFFEMLGNFSFGDYFKHEATAWAWEFCTKVLEMPADKIYISVYQDDDEAYDIWTKELGVSPDHMVRLGKEDNFWEHGAGPCGPCSELYFDRGEKYGCGSPTCGVGCDCDRYVEFWNLVFTQFDNDGNNNYTRLKSCNIDTGMGLERLACIMQGVDNLFEVDTVQNIMKHIMQIAGVKYHEDEKKDVSLRVITDHIRSTTFMIGDGVMPSNEGRGYVLRRLLRRAARHGRLLGIDGTFLYKVCETVIKENETAYPNLVEKHDLIVKVIKAEEESFNKTIDTGLNLLENIIAQSDSKVLSGADAFKLQDTFGFPIDLTKELLEERGMSVDIDEYDRLYDQSRAAARAARKDAGAQAWKDSNVSFKDVGATEFVGYTDYSCDAEIKAIVTNGERDEFATADSEVVVVLDKTPFYGESGGQAGDTGVIKTDNATLEVTATGKTPDGVVLHIARFISGDSIALGDKVHAQIDVEKREATRRNHTAAHLLQAALRKHLGSHVEQAGQLVNSEEMRFDFTHFSALSGDELKAIEREVNEVILKGIPVETREMPIEEAKKLGAMALFGEKYGDVVRVVSAGDFSVELCGGTHADNTAKLGLFKIVSESSVAAGIRRITAVTGFGVLKHIENDERIMQSAAAAMKLGNVAELDKRAATLATEVKAKDRELAELRSEISALKAGSLMDSARQVGGVRLITAEVEVSNPGELRSMCDTARDNGADIVAVFAGVNKEKGTLNFACACGADAIKLGAHAGNIVRETAKIAGGSGGGKPDSAMAGAKDASKADEALAAVDSIVSAMLK
ncbi:MAG: alanine--tRNA ligase [Oscillospiraceae bacterium]|nr:alanine--tRNA ligase [Oscillospiraceae bacterium]MDD6982008.1 alanine--tRNA ligase [Oscillospiraceae bacterium]MDY4623061.1 alanine--tRNA ligase [Oscillospiraceae bacterium]